MKEIYVNLKRFEVSRSEGGLCPLADPVEWITNTIRETVEMGIDAIEGVQVRYFLPEALLTPGLAALKAAGARESFTLGVQSVYRQDVAQNQNFGAFTSNRPAKAIKALGCRATLIGHSEERRDKLDMLARYDESILTDASAYQRAAQAVEGLLHEEAACALEQGMDIVYCIGETEQQKGGNDPAVYEPRVKEVIRSQIAGGLKGFEKLQGNCSITLGYEPIWAIGPGKTPPGAEYIGFVSAWAKACCKEVLGYELPVVYGGGLKEENAREIASVSTIDGGLIALTKFTPPIAFDVKSLKQIILEYVK
ncbi:MAG: triose-phosphate isomerase [Bacillota bacterium]